jgi:hypothetical protein
MNMNVLVPKNEDRSNGPQKQNAVFSKTAPTILIKFQQFMEAISLNKSAFALSIRGPYCRNQLWWSDGLLYCSVFGNHKWLTAQSISVAR